MPSPFGKTGLCPKDARLYLDMLDLLARVCQHQRADLEQARAWHNELSLLKG